MSLEDFDSEFKSDESDYEAEESAEDDSECNYLELFNLHLNLRRFQNIYTNNDIIDMENDASPGSGLDSVLSELEFILDNTDLLEDSNLQDFIQLYEGIIATTSPTSSSSYSLSSSSPNSNLSVSSDATHE